MTRRSSLRAAARENYGALAQADACAKESAPTPDPSPLLASAHSSPDGERPLAYGGGEKESLTARVRALYEQSAVPVAAIARLAGVTERTIYKHAAKGQWRPRYRWAADGARPQAFAPVKGAGGRFIRRADKGQAFAHGLKATDAPGRARAAAACGEAARLSAQAQVRAEKQARQEALIRAIDASTRAFAELARFRADDANASAKARERQRAAAEEPAKRPWRAWQQKFEEPCKHLTPARRPAPRLSPHRHRIESLLIRNAEIAVAHVEALLAPAHGTRLAHRMTPARRGPLPCPAGKGMPGA